MENIKKKVLFASRDLSVGGMEKALVTLLNHFDFLRYDVTLVLEKKQGALLSEVDPRVKITEYRVSDLDFVPLRKAINLLRRLIFKISHGGKYDFSCCFATYSTPCEKAAKIASPQNCLLYVHSDYFEMYKKDPHKTRAFFDSIGISEYKKIAFVSKEARDNAAALYGENTAGKFVTLGNLIDSERIKKLAEEKPDCDLSHDKKAFIFVGRLDDTSKKLCRLLDAAKITIEKNLSFEVWIVGDGPDGQMYREYAKECGIGSHISFFGEKKNPYPYIKSADCLIITSDYEGFPVVFTEAALLGKEIITTVTASDGFMTFDTNTVRVADKTPESVAEAMEDFICGEARKADNAGVFDPDVINSEKMKKLYNLMDV